MVRAALLTGPRAIEVERVELPLPAAGEAVVEIAACGICGTNLDGWNDPAHALPGARLPGVHGHEAAGVVTAVGPDAGVAVGDRVCLEPNLASLAAPLAVWGFAESIVVHADGLMRVPELLSLELATLAEPLASAIHGLRGSFTAVTAGGRLDGVPTAVIGAGVLGLLAIAAARDLGADPLVAVARHEHQAKAAATLGATEVLDAADPETVKRLRASRPRLVVEAVGGASNAVADAFAAVAPEGEVVVMGLFDGPRSLDVTRAVFRNVRAFFALAYGERDGVTDFALALDLLSRRQDDFRTLLTHRLPLGEAQRAFETAADKRSGAHRVLVLP